MLEMLLHDYKPVFQSHSAKGNILAHAGFTLINQLENATLHKKPPNVSKLYAGFGYQTSFLGLTGTFHPQQITGANLGSALLLLEFIKQLLKNKTLASNSLFVDLRTFLKGYHDQRLAIDLNAYREACLLIPPKHAICQLLPTLVATLKQLMDENMARQRQYLHYQQTKKARPSLFTFRPTPSAWEQVVHSSSEMFNQVVNSTYATWESNRNYQFIQHLEALNHRLQQTQSLTFSALVELEEEANACKNYLLSLAVTQEITHFHWLINLICNLVNRFVKIFESQTQKEIKHQFSVWQTIVELAATEAETLEQQFEQTKQAMFT